MMLSTIVLLLALPVPAAGEQDKPKRLQVGAGTKPFDVARHAVDLREIVQGGPPRDSIPGLVDPKFVSAVAARHFLSNRDEVIGIVENGKAKAYPIKILTHHEVVNDLVGGRAVAVTYRPFVDAGVVYDPMV